jgi:hypothetical protein
MMKISVKKSQSNKYLEMNGVTIFLRWENAWEEDGATPLRRPMRLCQDGRA